MKEHPILFKGEMVRAILAGAKTQTRRLNLKTSYAIGDRLWVRETFARYQTINHIRRMDGRAFSEVSDGCIAYRADGCDTIQELKDHIRMTSDSDFEGVEIENDCWRPSLFMPRLFSRITLEITELREERLKDISHDDACAEGIENTRGGSMACIDRYRTLWESINGPGSWNANPVVKVITFKVVGQS